MDERGIIIADRDGEYRRQMADFFQKAGYAVETSDSAVHVLCSVLEKQTPVLLLGSDFDKKVSSADLIHLLKKCNRHLHVIMVSDAMPLAETRQVREEGIFYHAFKPESAGDTAEIGLAVKCAFQKHQGQTEERGPLARSEAKAGAGEVRRRSRTRVCSCSESVTNDESPAGSVWWIITLVLVVLVTSYFSLVAAEKASQGNHTAIWIFLGFCALIVVSQLLPVFRIKLPFWHRLQEKEERDSTEK